MYRGEDPRQVIDNTVPHSARVWNYLLGGKDHYEADRRAADAYRETFPQITDIARTDRAFLGRAVHYLAADAGVRQFLDIGTGLPTMNNTHEVAQRAAPGARIVYVDNDPMVLTHARALLTSTPEGSCDYIHADLRNPQAIVAGAADTLDFTRPVALTLLGILHFLRDYDEARRAVRHLLEAVPQGSYLALTHATLDPSLGATEVAAQNRRAQDQYNASAAAPLTPRTREEIEGFFEGLELIEPGVVSMSRWRPEEDAEGAPPAVFGYCGVGRKG
ncbi:SAM-dependent methyltransferase [Streptomyces sp. CMB-StM0423]|uniref:SAM-dependent methyltransferase n=1 Tax=Streptomyces sp. CMB-StM0423 TaxID=2059884 RepID=UPI000C7010BE|nr:SAM-dependent methyltransferase [Streptomyces sp. CMB-StM0423]AUH42255.1 translation initiation factor IF-2 [Streptomyces sp. CMB-StM0423]